MNMRQIVRYGFGCINRYSDPLRSGNSDFCMKLKTEGNVIVKLGSYAKADHPETPTPENIIQVCNSH